MHELDRCGELDVTLAGIAEHLGGGERQHRPQPLAARRDQVVGNLRDHLDVGTGLRQDQFVNAPHIGRRKVDEILDRGGFPLPVFDVENDTHHKHSRL